MNFLYNVQLLFTMNLLYNVQLLYTMNVLLIFCTGSQYRMKKSDYKVQLGIVFHASHLTL